MSTIVPEKTPTKSEDPLAAQRFVRPKARHVDPVPPEKNSGPEEEVGSYGRGIYAGHSTFGLDFTTQGNYGRGIYAGHSTFGLDFNTPGSYGHGIYAGHSTFGLDFTTQGSFAEGMERGGQ